jgi:Leucine-rich repeat (LRR) protein
LTRLYLDRNRISTLPPEIGLFITLRDLHLRENKLHTVPAEIRLLTSLTDLRLQNNEITSLPGELGNVRSLERAASEDYEPLTEGLWVAQNPLPDPYPRLIHEGQPAATVNVLAWLRGELDLERMDDTSNVPKPQATWPDEPATEAGPVFQIASGKLDLVPELETASDFDKVTQQSLHRRLISQVDILHAETVKVGNRYPQLATTVAEYRDLVSRHFDSLDIVELWAVGNGLMAQAISFEQQDRLRTISEPLEPSHLSLLIHVAGLHGGFILGFPKAIELSNRSDSARIGPELGRVIAEPTSNVLAALSHQRKLLSERARKLTEVLDAALTSGVGTLHALVIRRMQPSEMR